MDASILFNNNTSANLGIGGVFTGTSEDITNYAIMFFTLYSDVESAADGFCIQFSSDGTDWHTETIEIGGEAYGGRTSLSLDSAENPHIACYDLTNDEIIYAYREGINWSIETVDSSSQCWNISMALDNTDYPHIIYSIKYILIKNDVSV